MLGAALLSACASFRNTIGVGARPSWDDALATAQDDAARGQFDSADSVLAAFANLNPRNPGALETAYWRALFKLDPSNREVSVPQAITWLDGYLADQRPRQHVSEALTLRRAAGQIDALNKIAANASAQSKDVNSAGANAGANARGAAADARAAEATAAADAKDAEIKRLKDELAKANAELERIRKRLSQPPRE